MLILATLVGRYRFDLVPGARIRARGAVTLHPDGPMPVTVLPRAA